MYIARLAIILLSLSTIGCVTNRPVSDGDQGISNNSIAQMLYRRNKEILDESFSIKAHSAHMRGIKLKRNTRVNIKVEGIKNTSKGFQVYVMPLKEWKHYQAGKSFKHYPSLQGLNVINYNKTGVIKKGSVAFVITNNNNIVNNMLVRLKITANP